jgi:hypothetical protein
VGGGERFPNFALDRFRWVFWYRQQVTSKKKKVVEAGSLPLVSRIKRTRTEGKSHAELEKTEEGHELFL